MKALPRGLIVSCQAREGSPLRGPRFMAAMAQAAVEGGAVAIRAEGLEDIRSIRAVVDVPIIGLLKRGRSPTRPYITPDLEAARAVAEAGADWIAIDATDRIRPGGPVARFIPAITRDTGLPVLADVATLGEGVAAARAGAGAVATTLSGYVTAAGDRSGAGSDRASSHRSSPESSSGVDEDSEAEFNADSTSAASGPDLDLVAALVRALAEANAVPILAEGRYRTPEEVARAFALGAHAVVVGTAITNPAAITRAFAAATGTAPAFGATDPGKQCAR